MMNGHYKATELAPFVSRQPREWFWFRLYFVINVDDHRVFFSGGVFFKLEWLPATTIWRGENNKSPSFFVVVQTLWKRFFLTFLAETRLARDGNCYDYDRFSSAQRKKNEPRDNKARLIGRTNCISLLASLLGSATTLVVAFRNRKNLLLLLILLVFFMNPLLAH